MGRRQLAGHRRDHQAPPGATARGQRDHLQPHGRRRGSLGRDQRQLAVGRHGGHVRLPARRPLHGQLRHLDHRDGAHVERERGRRDGHDRGGTSATGAADRFYFTEAPEFGRCAALKGTGAFSTGTCLTAGTKASYEWEPGLLHAGFTVAGKSPLIETVGRRTLSCAAVAGQGSYTGQRESSSQLIFSGCEMSSQKCTSTGAAGGEVRSALLSGTLVWEQRSSARIALLLGAEAAGTPLLQMQCGASAVEVRGAVVVPVKSGAMLSSQTLKFATAGGRGSRNPPNSKPPAGRPRPRIWK